MFGIDDNICRCIYDPGSGQCADALKDQIGIGGAQGVISVASNAVPACFARICRFREEFNSGQALALDAKLLELYEFLGVEPNPIPIKAIMSNLGFGHGLRLPLLSLSDAYQARAAEMTQLCKSVEQSI